MQIDLLHAQFMCMHMYTAFNVDIYNYVIKYVKCLHARSLLLLHTMYLAS